MQRDGDKSCTLRVMRKGEYDKRASLGTWYLGYINVFPSASLPYMQATFDSIFRKMQVSGKRSSILEIHLNMEESFIKYSLL